MAYKLYKETPQSKIKIVQSNERTSLTTGLRRYHCYQGLTTPSNNSQVWATWAAPSCSLGLDRKIIKYRK